MIEEFVKRTATTVPILPPVKSPDSYYNVTVFVPASCWVINYDTDKVWLEGSWLCFQDKLTNNKITISSGSTVIITGVLNFPPGVNVLAAGATTPSTTG